VHPLNAAGCHSRLDDLEVKLTKPANMRASTADEAIRFVLPRPACTRRYLAPASNTPRSALFRTPPGMR
jgi:hypothetical protein